MSQAVHKIRSKLDPPQLSCILHDCLDGEEVAELARKCGVSCNGREIGELPKTLLVEQLVTDFFSQNSTLKKVSKRLNAKAKPTSRRVGYMSFSEIANFMSSSEALNRSGELGATIWALLVDSRQQVQQHGYKLIDDNINKNRNYRSTTSNKKETKTEADRSKKSEPDDFQLTMKIFREQLATQKAETEKLQQELHEANKKELAKRNENSKLRSKIQKLIDLNSRLQAENQSLKIEKEELDQSSNAYTESLEVKNRELRFRIRDMENRSKAIEEAKRNEYEMALVSGLTPLEETTYKTGRILEEIQTHILGQIRDLGHMNEMAKSNIANVRKQILAPDKNAETDRGKPRVGVFVDVQNVFYAAKDEFHGRLDYIKLLDLLVGPRQLICANAYVVVKPEIDQSGFINFLEHNGYTIRQKDTYVREDGTTKGDWDVGIAIDIVAMLDLVDIVALVSGDGDFCDLVKVAQQRNKRVEVAAFAHNTSQKLRRIADKFFLIGEDMMTQKKIIHEY